MDPVETHIPHITPQWEEAYIEPNFLGGMGSFNPGPGEAAFFTATHHAHGGEQLRQHTEAEWTAMYPLIKRLYMTEHRRLREVVQLLRRNHGFSATPRMYKIRLARWGFFKNNSKKRPAVNSKGARLGPRDVEATNEPSNAGTKVDTNKDVCVDPPETERGPCEAQRSISNSVENGKKRLVKQGEKRQHASGDNSNGDTTRGEPEADGASDMLMFRASVPNRPTDTPCERRALSIFHCVGTWERPKAGRGKRPPPVPDAFASTEMYRSFGLASTLWSRGQGRLAGKAVRRAFLLAEEALAPPVGNAGGGNGGGDAMLMWNVVDVVNEMCQWGQGRLLRLFLEHLENMAACRAPRHPVRGIARDLLATIRSGVDGGGSGGSNELSEVAERAWRCNVDRVRTQFEAEEERVRRLVEGVSAAEAKRGHDGDGRPSDGVIARGIMEWVRSAELLRRSITPRNPYNPQPGQTRYETRVWYITVAAYATWSSSSTASSTLEAKISTRAQHSQHFAACHQQDDDDTRRHAILDVYVRKARLRALVDAREFDIAQPLAEGVLRFTDVDRARAAPHANDHQIRAIVARWAFEELLEHSGKKTEAQLVRDDNMRRVERFLSAIPDRLP